MQIALEPRHALHAIDAELGAEAQVGIGGHGGLEPSGGRGATGPIGVDRGLVSAGQAAAAIAQQIKADAGLEAPVLEASGVGIDVLFDQAGVEEQQLAIGAEEIAAGSIEQSPGLQPNLGRAVGAGGQVDPIAKADAKAEVKGPAQLQPNAAIDIESQTRNVESERQIEAGGRQALAQLEVELNRVGLGRQVGARTPEADVVAVGITQQLTIAVKPAGLNIGAGDLTIEVDVLQHPKPGVQQLVQALLDDRNRAAFGAELAAQVGQEAVADCANETGAFANRIPN